ncbi:MAG: YceI family protein [Gemmatimonadales bacterium]
MRSISPLQASSPGVPAGSSSWQLDPAHSHLEFAVRHLMISTVKGRFGDVHGAVWMDESDPSAVLVDMTIQVASIDTRQEQRDAHLRSPDFFDAARFPTITFRSRKVEGNPLDSEFRLVGDLTIRDITREVVLDVSAQGRVTDPWGAERAGFSAHGKIDRTDFGLTWNQALETGGVVVGNEVKISVEVELVRQAEQAAA